MTLETLVRAYVEAFNAGDWRLLREDLFTPDAQVAGVLGHGGWDIVLPVWTELHEGLSMRLEIVDLLLDSSRAAARLRETGRFVGPFRGLAGHEPTGRSYEISAIEWFEVEGGRIARRYGARDSAAIARQVLG